MPIEQLALIERYRDDGYTLTQCFRIGRRYGWTRGRVREILFGRAY